MRLFGRLTGRVLVCCAAMLVGLPAAALGDEPASFDGTGASSPLAAGSLTIPGAQGLVGPQQLQAEEAAHRTSPEAVAARRASRTAFAGLSAAEAAHLASEAFPAVIDEQAGGPPQLPAGQTITGFSSDRVARVSFPGGKRGVIESTAPMAVETSSGQRVPLDLGLADLGSAFAPATPAVGIRIPKQLSNGVRLTDTGVSLTPVAASGAPLGGSEGAADGAAVLYANTATDTDTVVKPVPLGFEIDAVLRSVASPQQLSFRVGLPAGGSLAQANGGIVQVLDEGAVIASVPPPSAHDAAGAAVPVSMSVSGDMLTLSVDHLAGEYQYPIEVDPEVIDRTIALEPGNWAFGTDNNIAFISVNGTGTIGVSHNLSGGEFTAGQYGFDQYQTQGRSHIYAFAGTMGEFDPHGIRTGLRIESPAKVKESPTEVTLPATTSPEEFKPSVCPSSCLPESVTEANKHNAVIIEDYALETTNWEFYSNLNKAEVKIEQEAAPVAAYDHADQTINGKPNASYLTSSKQWVNATTGVVGATPGDPGIGVNELAIKAPGTPSWGHALQQVAGCYGAQCNECWNWTSKCSAGESSSGEPWTYSLNGLPEGSDKVELTVENATGTTATQAESVLIDDAAPHNIVLSGLPSGNKIGDGFYSLSAEATDGSGSTESSGVASLAIKIDGREVGTPSGSCSPGPCTAKSSASVISGAEYGAGQHTLTVTATDKAGNTATETVSFTVQHDAPIGVGPGSANPVTGQFNLGSNDVSIGGGAGLTVSRSYNSRNLTAGAAGPLGPQWSLNVGGQESITVLPNGNATLTATSGGLATFTSSGGGKFASPPGDSNVTLSEVKNGKGEQEYLLVNATNDLTVHFISPSGSSTGPWKPAKQEGPLASQTVRYFYQTVEGITEPEYALAPEPGGLSFSCITKIEKKEALEKGCRALTFTYAKTTAAGENPSQWGEYKGRLMEVSAVAYNPATKAMATTAVASYSYDKQGRLRAEWDPRISPALKTIYGYDAEGHVTALSAPGAQPWVFTYGQIANDTRTGRLLAVTRPSAATVLGTGEAPVKTAAPALSTTHPSEGNTLSVTTGTWSNSPVAYGYQWERCKVVSGVRSCAVILGATNQTYTPVVGDKTYELAAVVTATNAGGSVAVESNFSSPVQGVVYWSKSSEFGSTGEGNVQFKDPWGITIGEKGNLFIVDSGNGRIEELTSSGGFVKAFGKKGSGASQFSAPEGITADNSLREPQVYVADSGNNRFTYGLQTLENDEYETMEGAPASVAVISTPSKTYKEKLYVVNHTKDVIVRYPMEPGSGDPFRGSEYEKFGSEGTGNGQFKGPAGIAVAEGGFMYVVDEGNDRVEELSESGTYTGQFGSKGTGNGDFSSPRGIAISSGVIYVADTGDNRIEEFNEAGEYLTQFATGSEPQGITISSSGSMYVTDGASNKVEVFKKTTAPNPLPAPPSPGTSSISTVEYNVPLQNGAEVPKLGINPETGKPEPAKWGQTDDPTEATAVFPPDEPMGWPAKDYTRATIYYRDGSGRMVNVASPGGAVSTTEYNSTNDVVRTLSPDNRAAALKESCVSETECKSATLSKLLDSESTYNTEGTQLQSMLGPQHTIKLASGSEAKARAHTTYSYDEGAPSKGGPFNLPTKIVQAAQLTGGEEVEARTTTTSYSGQENLGWTLRKPTSVTTDPGGLNIVHTTVYEPTTGNVVETRSPKGSVSGKPAAPVYLSQFGSLGSGSGQLNGPAGDAIDSSGNVWVTDKENNRVEKFSALGANPVSYGSVGKAADQFEKPVGIAVNSATGNVYVVDQTNNRIEELSASGAFVRVFGFGVSDGKNEYETCASGCKAGLSGSGSGQFNAPTYDAVDGSGNVWVVDYGNDRIEEFSAEGAYIAAYGSPGAGKVEFSSPDGIAVSDGDIFVVDKDSTRVEELSKTGAYIGQFGSLGSGNGQFKEPYGIATDPVSGNLYVVDKGNSRVEEFTPSGTFVTAFGASGTGNGQLSAPTGVAVNTAGDIYVADSSNNRIEEWEPVPASPVYGSELGSAGSGNGQFNGPRSVAIDSSGDIWAVDSKNNRVEELSAAGVYMKQFGSEGTGVSQFKTPWFIAINKSTGNMYVSDYANNRVEEFSSTGAFVRMFGFGVSKGEEKAEICTASCRAGIAGSGNGQFSGPLGIAIDSSGNVWVVDEKNARVEEFSETGTYLSKFGTIGNGNGQLHEPAGITISGGNLYVADNFNNRVEEFSTAGTYISQFGSAGTGEGQFENPEGIATDPATGNIFVTDSSNGRVEEFSPSGAFFTTFATKGVGTGQLKEPEGLAIGATGAIYIADLENNRVQEWNPRPRPGNEGAHDTRTFYYSAGEESEVAACKKHPEWANLPCQTEPVAQPGTSGLPELPITQYASYNMWDEAEKVTETVGSTTRTKTNTYDSAGRLKTSAISSTVGTALPTVTDEYSEKSGALEKQGTPGKTITSKYNSLGQLESYTDADENTSTYEYDVDGRIHKTNDGKGTQTYTYEATTGELTRLVDSAAGTFTATYDAEGNMLTEGYPNGMTAYYTYNQVGTATGLEYKKMTHCTEKCVWFNDAVVPSIHGQWLEQTSSLSKQIYTYDNAGRLTQVQNTPVGKDCTTRVYADDEETDRTSLTTRESSSETCSTEGGLTEAHTYDSADRLLDTGVVYNTFGDITSLPAADAGGKESSEELTSTYYTDNQIATQTQNGQTIGYNLDPAGRTRETVSTGKKVSDIVSHYAGPGNAPAWTVNTSGETMRNISGISGGLVATQTGAETPELKLANLHGDIIAAAYLSETATGLASTDDTSEFGVPTTSLPSKYSWLGALELPTELASGVIAMGARSYVPQLGRFLQPDPRPGGSANAYSYTFGDPVNSEDPTGEYTASAESWVYESSGDIATAAAEARAAEIAAERAAIQAAEEAAARREAEYAAEYATLQAGQAGPGWGEEEWEEWEEEGEEGYEYVSDQHGARPEGEEGHVESTVLLQPLTQEDEVSGEDGAELDSGIPICKAGLEGPCAHPARGGEGTCKTCAKRRRERHKSGSSSKKSGTTAVGERVKEEVEDRAKEHGEEELRGNAEDEENERCREEEEEGYHC